jgi:hypothetical protein
MIAVTPFTHENKLIIDESTADDALVMLANFIVNWQSTVLILVLVLDLAAPDSDGIQVTIFSPETHRVHRKFKKVVSILPIQTDFDFQTKIYFHWRIHGPL